jgi:predicted DNA-binding transcriptional regulator YafY
MNRTDRLYALVEELRAVAPRPRSARQLAERYEVSTRTIERDILALQESGVPIYAETGRRGGYAIDNAKALRIVRIGIGRCGSWDFRF